MCFRVEGPFSDSVHPVCFIVERSTTWQISRDFLQLLCFVTLAAECKDKSLYFLPYRYRMYLMKCISVRNIWAASTLRRGNLKTEVLLWKRIECFPSTQRRRNYKTQQSLVMLHLCSSKTGVEEYHDYLDVIIFGELRFQNVFRPYPCPYPNPKPASRIFSSLRSVSEKLRFRDVIVWAGSFAECRAWKSSALCHLRPFPSSLVPSVSKRV